MVFWILRLRVSLSLVRKKAKHQDFKESRPEKPDITTNHDDDDEDKDHSIRNLHAHDAWETRRTDIGFRMGQARLLDRPPTLGLIELCRPSKFRDTHTRNVDVPTKLSAVKE